MEEEWSTRQYYFRIRRRREASIEYEPCQPQAEVWVYRTGLYTVVPIISKLDVCEQLSR
jgi:hypothetical protein